MICTILLLLYGSGLIEGGTLLGEELFENITRPDIYNNRHRPDYSEGRAVVVNASLLLQSMPVAIAESQGLFRVGAMLMCTWRDPRLTWNHGSLTVISGEDWHANRIWTPPLLLSDQNYGRAEDRSNFLHLYHDGKVTFNTRVLLRLRCEMEYRNYPMDRPTCSLVLESGTQSEEDLILNWMGIDLNDQFHLPEFQLLDYQASQTTTSYPEAGNFSRLVVTFHIQRELQHFLLEIYIPSVLFVVTSWISFWLDIQAAPARIAVCLTSMLTLVTSTKSTREKIPPVSYVHALDVWNFTCIAFVFCSMLQYAVVNFIYTKEKRLKSWKRRDSTASLSSLHSETINDFFNRIHKDESKPVTPSETPIRRYNSELSVAGAACAFSLTPQDIALNLDRKCRLLFPAVFVLFNIFYWVHIHL